MLVRQVLVTVTSAVLTHGSHNPYQDKIFIDSDSFRAHPAHVRSPVTVSSPSPNNYHPYQQYPYYPSLSSVTPTRPPAPGSPAPPATYPFPPIPTYPPAPLHHSVPAITFLDEPRTNDHIEVRHRSFTPRPQILSPSPAPEVEPIREIVASELNSEVRFILV